MTAASCPDEADPYLPRPATLIETRPLTSHERFFRFETDAGPGLSHRPGQFLEISLPGLGECPISISSAPSPGEPGFELVVRRAGRVTRALHRLGPGNKIGMRGPFGTAFPVEDALIGRDLLFICGGLGLVPLRSAIRYVLDHRDRYGQLTVLLGARTPADRLFPRELRDWRLRDDLVLEETVDAAGPDWSGHVGVITRLIPRLRLAPENTRALVCGPPIMYRFVLKELERLGLAPEHIYLSLERRMKCGLGKCGHCQVNGLYTCRQGPVFQYADIAHVREAL